MVINHRPMRQEEVAARLGSESVGIAKGDVSASDLFQFTQATSHNHETRWTSLREAERSQDCGAVILPAVLADQSQRNLEAKGKKQAAWLQQALATVPLPPGAQVAIQVYEAVADPPSPELFMIDVHDASQSVRSGNPLGKHLGSLFVDAGASNDMTQVFYLAGGNFAPGHRPAFPGA